LKGTWRTYGIFEHAIAELERFFESTDALEDKKLKLLRWHGLQKANKAKKRSSR
jgi:hypothetical protein